MMLGNLSVNFYKWLYDATKVLTLVGIAGTTGISIYSLRITTVIRSDDPELPNRFTPAGKRYLLLLSLSTLFTIAVSVLQGIANRKIEAAEQRRQVGTFAAALNDQANTLLTNFDGDLRKSLADADAQISKNEAEITEGIRKQSSELHTLHESMLESSRNLSSLSALAANNARDLEAANSRVSNLFITANLIGVTRLQSRDCPTSPALAAYYHVEAFHRKCEDQKARDALARHDLDKRAAPLADLLSEIDPDHHFVFNPVINLRALTLWMRVGPCDDGHGRIAPGWCAESHIDEGAKGLPLDSATLFNSSSESPGFGFDFDEISITKRGYLSRDTDLESFTIDTCDARTDTENLHQLVSNLDKFLTHYEWIIEVLFTDPNNNNHVYKKQYRLRNIHEPYTIGDRELFTPCRTLHYEMF
jgi:hypothetical protein